ncbi:zinc finger BED domain-containing protein RICESLEEPER 2-like protein [Tanacetum coccineum]
MHIQSKICTHLEFPDSFQQNTGSFQETAREYSSVKATTSLPKTKSKLTRGRQKRTIQSNDAPQIDNMRKDAGFWSEVLQYMESKTQQYESGASDEDYYARALVDYEAENGTTFKLCHYWEILKGSLKWMQSDVPKFVAKSGEGSKRYKASGSSTFNTESGEASINLNVDVGDDEEDEAQEIRRPIGRDKVKDAAKKKGSRASGSSSMNDEALARLMASEMATENERAIEMQKEERLAFLEIKRREPYDHLIGDARAAMEALRAEIKAKYNLPY